MKSKVMSCRRMLLLPMLLLAAEHQGTTEAFSRASIAPAVRRDTLTAFSSTVENVLEHPTSQQVAVPDDLPDIASAEESQSIQLRSFDKDVFINTSIFIMLLLL